jgi:predicted GNAT family acetyltransferase
VDVRLLHDAEEFLAEAGPLLLADEARNNLILGVTGTLVVSPDRFSEKHFWVATEGGETVAAAMRTGPYNLLLAPPRDQAALEALAAGIEEELPGIVAAHPEVDDFTRIWACTHEIEPRVLRNQGVYALERVAPVPGAPGASRVATREDEPLLLDWMLAFGFEVLEEGDPGRAEASAIVAHRLADDDGGFALWEDGGEAVSLSGWGGPTPNGIRIGPVYTPPSARRRGYASALVAQASQLQLDAGRRFCFLFTDLANRTANHIYRAIGYEPVRDVDEYRFEVA